MTCSVIELKSKSNMNTMDKEQKECLKVQQDVIDLNNLSISELEIPHNPLYSIKILDSDRTNQVGTISAISDQDGIMEIVYGYLELTDVVQLERTCKRYVKVERTRRIAIGNALGLEVGREPLDHALINYINNTSDSSTVALQKFLSEVKLPHHANLQSIDAIIFRVNKMTASLDPVSFEVFLESTNYNRDVLFGLIDMKFGSRRDFQTAKYLLREDNNGYGFLKLRLLDKVMLGLGVIRSQQNNFGTILDQVSSLLDDEGSGVSRFTKRFFMYFLDLELMKLTLSIDDDDDDNLGMQVKEKAFMILSYSILVKSKTRRRKMSEEDPLFTPTMAFHSLYTECFPDTGSYPPANWVLGQFDKDAIKQYWIDDPGMLRIWKVALFKALNWVREFEKARLVSDYLLLSRIVLGEDSMKHPNSLNCFSLGPFLVMQSVEFGGAVALSVRLEEEDAVTDLFYNYYEFLRLYQKGYQELKEWNDRLLATHASAIAAINHAAAQP